MRCQLVCAAVRPAQCCWPSGFAVLHYCTFSALQCPPMPSNASNNSNPPSAPLLRLFFACSFAPALSQPAEISPNHLHPRRHAMPHPPALEPRFHRGSARPLGSEWKRGGRSPRSPPSLFVLSSRSCAQRHSAPAARAKADIRGSTLTSVCDSLPPRVVGRSCFTAVNPEPSLVRR